MAMASRIPCWISRCRLNSFKRGTPPPKPTTTDTDIRAPLDLQTSSAAQSQNLPFPLYPSVAQLLHEKGIPTSDASKIPASGPQGRLLKGDILAFIGAIPADYSSNLSAQISKLAHLDLSNIKIKKPLAESQTKPEPPLTSYQPSPPHETEISLPISLKPVLSMQERLQKVLGITVPLSTLLARATDTANEALPASQLTSRSQSADALFDEIIGIAPTKATATATNPPTSRGNYIPEVFAPEEHSAPAPTREVQVQELDIIDILSGKAKLPSPPSAPSTKAETPLDSAAVDLATNIFSIKVPVADRLRGETFLARLRDVLQDQPESLVF
ncbi:hypothetical protein ACO22_04662 [Paracoccidioides brasiliensis]|uniref:Peripheral subunit-binding (PSBD) domain-containing protein n=1 Tax=Paracoccidioides brasiliensis TaxID=121759 RepID=A0A1D2JCI8_PARBR|nr:hypothetical protein ACO22_04662 [Paracoccidioides brasiliensis]